MFHVVIRLVDKEVYTFIKNQTVQNTCFLIVCGNSKIWIKNRRQSEVFSEKFLQKLRDCIFRTLIIKEFFQMEENWSQKNSHEFRN